MAFAYDMVVIGGGAAGLTASGMSALLGAKTALVERRRLGGDCTWYGCVPSKTLLRAARTAHEIKSADGFNFTSPQRPLDFSKVMDHVRQTSQRIYEHADAPPQMEKLGVEVISGTARFADPHTIEVADAAHTVRRLSSRYFVIAAGSRPRMPDVADALLTNESLFDLQVLPERLLILGAGPVGIEMAQAFARLGSKVEVVSRGNRILRRDDPKHSARLLECLRQEGIVFHLEQKITSIARARQGLTAYIDDGHTVECDAALAAMGRTATVEQLGLECAGVRVEEKGIVIDNRCRTTRPHIYAVGDVTGQYNFTHMAEHMSKVAITNAILRWPARIDARHVVWSTYTDPELAHLGESEAALRKRKADFSEFRFPFEKLDRAITEGATLGEVKVFADKRGRILGASILGANAGEMISEYALAMRHGLRLTDIANTIHPYPTFLLGNRRAADQYVTRHLDSPLLTLLGRILRYRGTRKGAAALASLEP